MQPQLIRELEALLGPKAVLSAPEDLMLYEYDGSVELGSPRCVVFPASAADVAGIVGLANRYEIPIVGRGAGTGLSGGAIARSGGVVIVFSRMNRILEIDAANLRAVIQPGVVNLDLSRAVEHLGLYFAPDPSSQKSCTIGGNVSENSGGPHTLANGVTANHVTGLELVLPDGEIVRIGGKSIETSGYDLCGLLVGSEGTLALVTEITVRLMRKPEAVKTLLAVYDTLDDTTESVVEITVRAITPAACEMLDGFTLRAVEDYVHAGFPKDCAAVLLIEVEGLTEAVEARAARDDRERNLLWRGRKEAFGALGRISPMYYVQDGVIPRTRIPETLRRIEEIARKYDLLIGNIFHAGDGNLHPLILFDERDRAQFARVVAAGGEIMRHCVEVGGALTGEHGIGMEKNELMPLIFTPDDLALMERVRAAFNPSGRLNPGKVLPMGKACGEIRVPHAPAPAAIPT
jgi:glycolate oxidase